MNWMCSSLDAYQLVSNSDAHSPSALGREATTFRAAIDFFSLAEALRTGDGLAGPSSSIPKKEVSPDRHRKCGISFEPRADARA
jgi:DNA helicase-2/ATP-dependent DNA helicase PcrA